MSANLTLLNTIVLITSLWALSLTAEEVPYMKIDGDCLYHKRPEENGTLHLVAHHKSGTYLASDIAKMVYNSHNSAKFHLNGLEDKQVLRSDYYLHTIRHPLDMLVSGYVYHKRCAEKWTMSPVHTDSRFFPPGFSVQLEGKPVGFCEYLGTVSPVEGLKKEFDRSMGIRNSNDGMGRMIRNMRTLRTAFGTDYSDHVLEVCLKDILKTMKNRIENFIMPWNRCRQHMDDSDHFDKKRVKHINNASHVMELYSLGIEVLKSKNLLNTALTFPCSSEYISWPNNEIEAARETLPSRT